MIYFPIKSPPILVWAAITSHLDHSHELRILPTSILNLLSLFSSKPCSDPIFLREKDQTLTMV